MELWKSAAELLESEKLLKTGCQKLDSELRGGISKKGITQIYGEAGTGKTQLALQLCLSVQLEDNKGAAFICTESAFPIRRLQQLLNRSELATKHGASANRIFIEHISTIIDLESCILERISALIESQKIGLLVIDSIAAPYRSEYNDQQLKNRAKSFRTVGQYLHNISTKYNVSVICINQVSAAVESNNSSNVCNGNLPALGITWSTFVTNSYCLTKNGNHRSLHVRESPYVPRKTIPYEIREDGFFCI